MKADESYTKTDKQFGENPLPFSPVTYAGLE